MQDRPNTVELLAAVQQFLENELLPLQDDQRLRFRTRVAANALAIVQRELGAGAPLADEESERLRALLPDSVLAVEPTASDAEHPVRTLRRELARRIRAGQADGGPWRQAVFAATLASVRAKLLISNPKLLERYARQ